MPDNLKDREARQGQKMVEVRLRFWTNDIAGEGKIRPRHAWSSGVVRVERNDSHGIVPGSPLPFHTLLDVGSVIERALIQHGIVLHPSPKMAKYINASLPEPTSSTVRSEAARKANVTRGAQGRSNAAKKANASRTPAARSEAAKKASVTRKRGANSSDSPDQ